MASTPEKLEYSSGTATPNAHASHHSHFHDKRFHQFVKPDGRRVHIAQTPEHHETLKKQLSRDHPSNDFDVFIHGTAEHLAAIRELHAHSESRRDQFREEHGAIYDDFEKIKQDLDALSTELHMLTDHGVSLDANFSKFGYSAHLRTKDEDGASSPGDDDHSSIRKAQDRSAEALKFWKRPVVRQYFHKGKHIWLLWRSSKSGEVGAFELFVDLLYVGIIGVVGDKAAEDPTGKALIEYCITFSLGWRIWSDLTVIVNWFEIDDILQRISVMVYLICLFGYTTNIAYGFETTYTSMIAFYLTERLFVASYFTWVAYLVPTITGTMIYNVLIMLFGAALWIVSIHVEYPNRLAPIIIAIAIDLFGSLGSILLTRFLGSIKNFNKITKGILRYFEFYPAINIEHRTERNSAFVSLVFGYSVLTILFQNRATFGMNAFLGKGILGLIQAFVFNWIYFEVDHYCIHVHAIRRSVISSITWVSGHLPFIMSYTLAAATLSKLVLASDCSDTDIETLGENYVGKAVSELSPGLRWFYCGGLGTALLSMGVISLSHIHKRLPNARLKKRPRLVVRACVSIVIICLPLAHSLTSLDLISITTALVVFVLILDLYGNSVSGGEFWTGGFCEEQKRQCQYSAKLPIGSRKRRELEKALRNGQSLTLKDLLSRQSSVSSLNSERPKDEEWHGGHI